MSVWEEFQEEGAFAFDLVDGNLTNSIEILGQVNVSEPGEYSLEYRVVDSSGNLADSIYRIVSVGNDDPSELILSNEFILENLPIDTEVGSFSVVDPNDAEGTKSYDFELLTYTDELETPFYVDTNGILRTLEVLDYEEISTYEIQVRVSDEFGGSLDMNFTLSVVDEHVPIVWTLEPVEVGSSYVTMQGELLDEGDGSGVSEMGFLFSTFPGAEIDQVDGSEAVRIISENGVGIYDELFGNLDAGQRYFYRSYALNEEGISYGFSEKFVTSESSEGPDWAMATSVEGAENWWTSSWFGQFFLPEEEGWILHEQLGWIFTFASTENGVWIWMEELGWCWTDYQNYPFLYSESWNSWLYFYGSADEYLLFHRYSDNQLLVLQNSGTP